MLLTFWLLSSLTLDCCSAALAIWVAMSWQPIFDRANSALGFRASLRDVTAQTRSVAMMLDAKNELERLLHAASHDLQEPVRLMQTYCQKLDRQLPAELAAQTLEKLGRR